MKSLTRSELGVEWRIGVDGGRRRPDRVGLGVEWSGLVVSGSQIGDVEQEGEEELRKKREKRGSLADA